MRLKVLIVATLCLLCLGPAGCDTKLEADADMLANADVGADDQTGGLDQEADGPAATSLKVAAIQYDRPDHTTVPGCETTTDGTCGILHFIRKAAQEGAKLVVTPSHSVYMPNALEQEPRPEPDALPAVGDTPLTDPRWKAGTITHTMAQAAVDEKITLVFTVVTFEGADPNKVLRNTVLVIDPKGKVVVVHNVFHIFWEKFLTEGTSVATSFYDSPVGKTGVLANADIQCIVTNMKVQGDDCTQHAKDMLLDYSAKKPDVVLDPTSWVGADNATWQAMNVFPVVAKAGWNAWFVVANQRNEPNGNGGGIWKPDGTADNTVKSNVPTIVYGTIPYK